jgi:hypothetical protein
VIERSALLALLTVLTAACTVERPGDAAVSASTLWCFDRLDRIGGRPVRSEGQPLIIETAAGRAIQFDGVDDALFFDVHPLAGARTFTMEAIFRPDGGAFEQRWLHLAEAGPGGEPGSYPPVPPSGSRFLFEIRVVGDRWYLDTFVAGPGYRQALMFPEKAYPLGRWYHVAQVYDGRFYRAYVNGELQGEAEIAFTPQGAGYSSVGTRINRRDYFKGAVRAARFTPQALTPSAFLPADRSCGRR